MLHESDTYSEVGKKINLQRLFFRIVRYWYLILGCLFISLSIAFIKNKQAQKVFQADMSLQLKDDQVDENSAALLYQNSLMASKSSLSKDQYLITSSSLVFSTLKKLEFDLSFYREERKANAEVYPKLPVRIVFENGRCIPDEVPFYFIIISETAFLIFTENKKNSPIKANFGNPIVLNNCQMTFIKSGSLKSSVGQQYAFVYHDLKGLTKKYQNNLSARAISEEVNVLLLSVRDENANKAIDFLSEIANTYILNNISKKNERASRGIKFIDEQLRIASDTLMKIESHLQHIQRSNKIGSISQEGAKLFSRLEFLDVKKSEIRLAHIFLDTLFEYLRPNKNISKLIMPSAMGLNDPVLNSRIVSLVTLQVEKKKLDSLHTRNPYYGKMIIQIREEKQRIIEVLKNVLAEKKIEEDEIDRQLYSVNQSIDQLPLKERELISVQRKYASTEALFNLLNNKLAEISITKASSLPDFEVVDPPTSSGSPIAPNFKQNYLLAVFSGLGIPVGILFLMMMLSTTIESVTDIKKLTSFPLLGVIGNHDNEELILAQNKRSLIGESFRTIRSKLKFLQANEGGKVYMITSCFCGEGKTYCSTNLAIVHALSGVKTLLVSADMRKHHTYNGLITRDSLGLSDYLANPIPLAEIIHTTKIDNLSIIATGKLPNNPSELLSSSKVGALVKNLKDEFDIVIVDTPPLGIISDAMNFLQFSDCNILIVRQNFTHKNLLRAVDEMCISHNLAKINIIFNDVKFSKLESKYGYYYGNIYGYEYQNGHHDNRKKSTVNLTVES